MDIDISHLSAMELDALIAAAGERRCKLQPPVPAERPGGQIEAIMNPAWAVSMQPTGTLLQVCHRSFGWLAFIIPPPQRAELLSHLLQHAIQQTQSTAMTVTVSPSAPKPEAVTPTPGTDGGSGRIH